MGVWTGTGFPSEKATEWASAKTPFIWVLTALYLFVVLYCPGRIPVWRHRLLPHWYRWNRIFQMGLLFAFVPEMLVVLTNGFTESVCRTGSLYSGSFSGTIVMLFVISKVVDLAETVLIIMEGRKPLAVHIIHHAVTLLYTWHSYLQQASVARWFVFANLAAHVILYSYLSPNKFGLRPCWLMVAITQMTQLAVCLLVSITAQNVISRGDQCDVNSQRLPFDKFICVMFIILFADFYHQKIRQMRHNLDFQMAREIRSHRTVQSTPKINAPSCSPPLCTPKTTTEGCRKKNRGWTKTGITPTDGSYSTR